ncbi:hypothetical protein SLEP1_g52202 [Rubroshorea leprosula]|uniref:Uncharacterized protein n=1 Tax=Rubroshorea leprosula TaxID=152421 RepID=A0AAV5M5I8_9ROSI|nr:hypothetical protein SLEP1_g52202 [Rubroshorea leprosula]
MLTVLLRLTTATTAAPMIIAIPNLGTIFFSTLDWTFRHQ